MKAYIKGVETPGLVLAAFLTVAAVIGQSSVAKADARTSIETVFEVADGARHSRGDRSAGRKHVRGLRADIERQRRRIDQLYAEAARAERRARRAGKGARRAIDPSAARKFRKVKRRALRERDDAELAALRAERRLSRLIRQSERISSRQQRVDRLAPRPKLAPVILRKIDRYAPYRRRGENTPAFVVRIAQAERLSAERGESVAYWLNHNNRRPEARSER